MLKCSLFMSHDYIYARLNVRGIVWHGINNHQDMEMKSEIRQVVD